MANEKIYEMKFSKVFPLLIAKAERKGKSKEEVYEITSWLTGYTDIQLDQLLDSQATYQEFITQAPEWNANSELIKGVICGIRVENIEEPIMKKIRQLDKLIDELAKGKKMEKILRK
ncbi:MAG: DUF2200 domain-containing protein [Firmicutes bacterium]|nr:DUF2200 domain-containing protein [Bacillota bacterium]